MIGDQTLCNQAPTHTRNVWHVVRTPPQAQNMKPVASSTAVVFGSRSSWLAI